MKAIVQNMRGRLLPLYGAGEAQAVIREIFRYLKGWDITEFTIRVADNAPLSDYIRGKVEDIMQRLEQFEPLQYIIGRAYFYGIELRVQPGVLIPRPETEDLVREIVAENSGSDLRVADLGTGSGAIAVALGRYLRFPKITALDLSAKAVEVARENVRELRCTGVEVRHGDMTRWQPDRESYDIVVSNPPYIDFSERAEMHANVVEYEPAEALFVPDADPLKYYRAIAAVALPALVPGGRLYFEINPRHVKELEAMLLSTGYCGVQAWRDERGLYRYIKAFKPMADD